MVLDNLPRATTDEEKTRTRARKSRDEAIDSRNMFGFSLSCAVVSCKCVGWVFMDVWSLRDLEKYIPWFKFSTTEVFSLIPVSLPIN